MWLELVGARVELGGRDVLAGVSARIGEGELIAIVGPNGAGKSTLLRALAGLIAPRAGTARVFGMDPARVSRRELARSLAYLPQQYELAFPYVVEEVVLLGRYASQTGLGLASEADLAAAHAAMVKCDVAHLAERRFDELSGGEARRVIVAQALCQGARLMLLDEPTAGLDPAHARAVFEVLRAHADSGGAAICVTHDLDLALRHATAMWLVADGGIAARGSADDVLRDPATAQAFGTQIHIGALPDGGKFAVPA